MQSNSRLVHVDQQGRLAAPSMPVQEVAPSPHSESLYFFKSGATLRLWRGARQRELWRGAHQLELRQGEHQLELWREGTGGGKFRGRNPGSRTKSGKKKRPFFGPPLI